MECVYIQYFVSTLGECINECVHVRDKCWRVNVKWFVNIHTFAYSIVRCPLFTRNVYGTAKHNCQMTWYKTKGMRHAFECRPVNSCQPGVTGAPLHHGWHSLEEQNQHHQVKVLNKANWFNKSSQWKATSYKCLELLGRKPVGCKMLREMLLLYVMRKYAYN